MYVIDASTGGAGRINRLSKGWIIEINPISYSKSSGIVIGKERSLVQNLWKRVNESKKRNTNERLFSKVGLNKLLVRASSETTRLKTASKEVLLVAKDVYLARVAIIIVKYG